MELPAMKISLEERVFINFFAILAFASSTTFAAPATDTIASDAASESAKNELMPCSKIRTTSAEPSSIEDALTNYRVKFEQVDDDTIKVRDGDFFYFIDLYKDDAGFHSLTFSVSFEKIKVGLQQINSWNQERRFSRAYLTKDKLAVLEMDLNMVAGGMPDCQFQDNLYVWLDSLGRFHDTIYKLK
jgi:Putative bacterial sensory transduction regulator